MLEARQGKAADHGLGALVPAVAIALSGFAIAGPLLGTQFGGLPLPAVTAVGLLLVGARLAVHAPAPVLVPVRAGRPFGGRGRERDD